MLTSDRGLVLRAIEESDLEFVAELRNTLHLEELASREPPLPRSVAEFRDSFRVPATRRAPADGSPNSIEFVCEVEGEPAGIGGLYAIDFFARHAEIGVTFKEGPWRGKGLGIHAHHLLLDYAFRWLNLRRVHASVHETNKRIIIMCHRLGFVDDGCRKEFRWVNGTYVDLNLLSIGRDDWEKRYPSGLPSSGSEPE